MASTTKPSCENGAGMPPRKWRAIIWFVWLEGSEADIEAIIIMRIAYGIAHIYKLFTELSFAT